MLKPFLCPVHRKWISLHPAEALSQIETAKKQGEHHRQNQQWEDALPQLGRALEMTEVMMDTNKSNSTQYSLLYTSLAVSVADTLYRLEQMESASYTLSNSAAHLNQIGDTSNLSKKSTVCIMECIRTLRKGAQFFAQLLHQPHASYLSANLH